MGSTKATQEIYQISQSELEEQTQKEWEKQRETSAFIGRRRQSATHQTTELQKQNTSLEQNRKQSLETQKEKKKLGAKIEINQNHQLVFGQSIEEDKTVNKDNQHKIVHDMKYSQEHKWPTNDDKIDGPNKTKKHWTPEQTQQLVMKSDLFHKEGSIESSEKETTTNKKFLEVVKHPDNLHPEGRFAERPAEQWAPGERAQIVRHDDNLHMEGRIDTSRREWATKGERVEVVKHQDNLRPEGAFEGRKQEGWAPGERAPVVKRPDNLRPEGSFASRPADQWAPGEKAKVVKHPDNLHPEGRFAERPAEQWAPGERAQIVRHDDNLHMEGRIDTSRREWATKGERVGVVKHQDNLRPEGASLGRNSSSIQGSKKSVHSFSSLRKNQISSSLSQRNVSSLGHFFGNENVSQSKKAFQDNITKATKTVDVHAR